MASRRDQLHSYQFMIQRVVAALVMRETDPAQSPFRRAAGAIFAGIMVAAITVAGFMVYGLWKPGGNTEWMKAGGEQGKPIVVVEEETGAVYVFRGGVLYPAANFTSAMLAAGAEGGNVRPQTVSRNSLADSPIRRGDLIGIPGAPDALPSPQNLISGDWSLCSQPKINKKGAKDGLETVMVVGQRPSPLQLFGGESVLLVEDEESSDKYIVYKSYKFKIVGEDLVRPALNLTRTPLKVGAAWLTALPEGEEIKPLDIPGDGGSSTALDGATVGDVYQTEGLADRTYYVALQDKFASVTELQAALLMASRHQADPMRVSASDLKQPSTELLPKEGEGAPPESARLNELRPNPDQATCAIFGSDDKPPTMAINGQLPIGPYDGTETQLRGESGERLTSRVVVANGRGAFVHVSRSGKPTGMLVLVTDTGKYYPLASDEVIKLLGYDPKKTPYGLMPENLVARLPRGPTLDPADAVQPVLSDQN